MDAVLADLEVTYAETFPLLQDRRRSEKFATE